MPTGRVQTRATRATTRPAGRSPARGPGTCASARPAGTCANPRPETPGLVRRPAPRPVGAPRTGAVVPAGRMVENGPRPDPHSPASKPSSSRSIDAPAGPLSRNVTVVMVAKSRHGLGGEVCDDRQRATYPIAAVARPAVRAAWRNPRLIEPMTRAAIQGAIPPAARSRARRPRAPSSRMTRGNVRRGCVDRACLAARGQRLGATFARVPNGPRRRSGLSQALLGRPAWVRLGLPGHAFPGRVLPSRSRSRSRHPDACRA